MSLGSTLRRLLPAGFRRRLGRAAIWPPVGRVRFGHLRRLKPISGEWGFDRGTPIDRFYIESFLARHAADISGVVLEVDAPTYTRRFGGNRVTRSEVLHVEERRPGVTMIGDLTQPDDFEPASFDCVILTQTLQLIFDPAAAIRTVHSILRPGGVVLATVPGITKLSREDMDRWGQFWSFTSLSMRRLFEPVFGVDQVQVSTHGNVLTSSSFLYGLAAADLHEAELKYEDSDYEVVICVRAIRPPAAE